MPKRAVGLTARRVESEKRPGMYADGGGLYLRVAPGSKGWIFRYMLEGKRRDMGLGPIDLMPLGEARETIFELRRSVRQGIDPIDRRRGERTDRQADRQRKITFAETATAYMSANEAAWRNPKHRAQWSATLNTYAYPVMGEVAVARIDTSMVMAALEPIWTAKVETASRLRGRIEAILDYAKTRGVRHGDNPARWKGHLENLLPKKSKIAKVEHHTALPYGEMRGLMAQLRGRDSIASRALRFCILTCTRTSEALGARWDEIDLDRATWTIPAGRMKAGRDHRVPLSSAATGIVREMALIRSCDYVFPGQRDGKPLSNMAMLMQMRRMGRGDLTAHGFRSSFRDWAAEQTSFPTEAAELALAHQVGTKVEAAYRRSDLFERRRELAEAWAAHCVPMTGEYQSFNQ